MSFLFPSWSTAFSPAFHEDAKAMLEGALNKGNKPPVIQGRIEVVELSMGKEPPTLTLLEIGDLSLDRFRGILRLGYQGDAWLEVRCRVQANPLSHNPHLLPSSTLPLSTPLLASQPLLVPMTLRLSRLHLRAILILVVSASKGITLVFKNDPLQNVDVSSTFDSVEVIRGYLQQEIEGQLREMFREDLPGIIHRLSQRWFTGTGVGGKVEMPYREEVPAPMSVREEDEDEVDPNDPFAEKPIFPPSAPSVSSPSVTPRKKASSISKTLRDRRSSIAASESPTSYTVFPDIEDYDPTYGLRPEGLPTHSGYEAFGRLWEKARQGEGRGLGGLMNASHLSPHEEDRGDVSDSLDDENDEVRSFDMVEMEDSLRALGSRPGLSRAGSTARRSAVIRPRIEEEDEVEWETFPAVGGGVITRPRVYHSQSQIRAPSDSGRSVAMPSPSATGTGSVTARASSVGGASSTIGSLRIHPAQSRPPQRGQPGPSSLRRLVTSRSDVFLTSHHQYSRSESFSPLPTSSSARNLSHQLQHQHGPHLPPNRSNLSRRQSHTASSSAARTGSSWDTDKPARSSTLASSQIPSSRSRPLSIDSKTRQHSVNIVHNRAPSFAGTSPGTRPLITIPLNNSVSQLATLSHSNHTLSPYARGHEHIAVRSFPHLGKSVLAQPSSDASSSHDGTGPIKARRKRLYHLGGKKKSPQNPNPNSPEQKSDEIDSPPISPSHISNPASDHTPIGRGMAVNDGGDERTTQWKPSASLTGVAQRVMMSQDGRPNMSRSPNSRTSYGFPTRSNI
ncbi:hypothetical protein BCR39DRAFT_515038 [Naematelia encephala]|uniref:Mitochondrial distribution and morphology protein 34 n=1 Tax=Naematelia encephala TaxID=71784 RepID=A0A1Y2BJ85_9TREE|nr:hypothetical protein BCR39DRAFT_515038 [Naematelia encephala]